MLLLALLLLLLLLRHDTLYQYTINTLLPLLPLLLLLLLQLLRLLLYCPDRQHDQNYFTRATLNAVCAMMRRTGTQH